jgi:hypothetical protein
MNQELLHDVAVRQIQEVLSGDQFKDLHVVIASRTTGTSFFQGNDRLCKVLKTKRGLRIEINVDLPEELISLPGMVTIDAAEAYSKHYGTVRHIYKGESLQDIKSVMTEAVRIFKQNIATKQAQLNIM